MRVIEERVRRSWELGNEIVFVRERRMMELVILVHSLHLFPGKLSQSFDRPRGSSFKPDTMDILVEVYSEFTGHDILLRSSPLSTFLA